MAPPNIKLDAPKRNSRPVITITPTPSDIERKEMRQNSQKHFEMLKILAMNLQSNGLLLIEPLLTNPGPDPAISAPTSCHLNVVVQSFPQWGWVEMAGQISRGARPKGRPIVSDCFFAGLPIDRSQLGGSSSSY